MALTVNATYTPAPLGANYTGIVKWEVDEMLVGEKGTLIYEAIAADINCPNGVDVFFENAAWISSETDSPDSSKVDLMITCAELPPVIDPQTSLFKRANRSKADIGEVVTYTLKYINTEGTVVDGDLSTQTGWKKLANGNIPLAKGYFSLDQNNNQGVPPPYFFAHEKSYGVNGTLETTWDATNTSLFYLVFRYTAGTPYANDFKGVCLRVTPVPAGQGTIKFEVLDGTKVVATETANVSYPTNAAGTFNPIDIKVRIQDDKMYVYVNDFETVLKSYSGLVTTTAGYVGVYSGSGGNQHKMNSFHTDFDHAFDITLYDKLPVELGSVASISNAGVWNASQNLITWPKIVGPIKANDSLVYTFNAEVKSCNNFITNLGKASVYGMDTLRVLNTISCGSTICTPPSGVLLTASSSPSLCEGDSVLLMALPVSGSKYEYVFMRDGTTVQGPGTKNTYYAKTSGDYSVSVYPVGDPLCEATSAAVTVEVHALPTATLSASATAQCEGTVTLTAAGGTGSWEYSFIEIGGINLPAISAIDKYTVSKSGSYYAIVYNSSNSNCYSYTDTIEIQIDIRPALALTSNSVLSACKGTAGGLIEVTAITGGVYSWTDENGALSTQTNSYAPALPGTYSVTVTSGLCDVSLVDIEVVELALPEYTISTTDPQSICVGSAFPEVALTITGTGPYSFAYSDGVGAGVIETSVNSPFKLSPSSMQGGTYTFSLLKLQDAANGCYADIDPNQTVSIQIEAKPELIFLQPDAVCSNGDNVDLSDYVSSSDMGTYKYSSVDIPAGALNEQTGAVDLLLSGSGILPSRLP
ncbi:MAG: hypothetical protein IPO21_15540 [Bacteroidales bacterium]|nr:hypothetical protein [Bacteroidales bacterium]